MSTTCRQCGAVAVEGEARRDFLGMCPGCLAGFALEAPEELETLGPYRLLEVLGSGGMGVVYRAVHVELGKEVALKLLRPHLTESERERFRHEARTLAKVRHPNVVPIHDFGTERGWFWFVMDLVRAKPLSPGPDAVRTLRSTALAVQHLHDRGILHRDLKPQNILVDDAGEPRLVDFGLAKTRDASLTPSNALLGTPGYMSPEQVRGAEPDVRSDVYALGAVLYECLAGRPPFEGRSPAETLRRVADEDPVPPPGDPALVRVCLKALEKDPARRYATAAEFAEDLGRYLDGRPVAARAPDLRPGRFVRRRAAWILSAFLLVSIGTSLFFALRPPRAAAPTPRIEEFIAAIPDKQPRYLMAQGLQHYRDGDWWGSAGYFRKCADYLEERDGGLDPEARARARQQCWIHIALSQWRLGHRDETLGSMRRAVAAGFRDDGAFDGDDAFRAMRADRRFSGLVRPLRTLDEIIRDVPERDLQTMLREALADYRRREYWRCLGYLEKLADRIRDESRPLDLRIRVQVLRALCRWALQHPDAAWDELKYAVEMGFRDDGSLDDDDHFRAMKADPRFAKVVRR